MTSALFSRGTPEKSPVYIILHLDTGRGNCRGAVVRGGPEPIILHTSFGERKSSEHSHTQSISSILSSLSEIVRDISTFLTTSGSRFNPTQIFCILPAFHYFSDTNNIKSRAPRGETFEVTPTLIASLIKKGENQKIHRGRNHLDTRLLGDAEVITRKIISIKVNGYETPKPLGKRGEEVELALFETQSGTTFLHKIRRAINQHISLPIVFEPFSLASFVAVRDYVPQSSNFLFLTVSNEASELSLIRDASLVETIPFAFGTSTLLRHIAKSFSTSIEDAESSLTLFRAGALKGEEAKKIEKALTQTSTFWISLFQQSAAVLSEDRILPPHLYAVVEGDYGNIFREFLKSESFIKQTLAPAGFGVSIIDTNSLESHVTFSPQARPDSLLALEALFGGVATTQIPIYPQLLEKTAVLH